MREAVADRVIDVTGFAAGRRMSRRVSARAARRARRRESRRAPRRLRRDRRRAPRISHASFGDYSYIMEDGQVLFATIGKFCSIASNVRINAAEPSDLARQPAPLHLPRRRLLRRRERDDDDLRLAPRKNAVTIGHDVWIGHGATSCPASPSALARSSPPARW